MDKIEITDEFLYQHVPGYMEKVIDSLPDADEIDYEFSEEFKRKMEILIKRARLKEKYHIPITTGKRVAAAILLILSITLSVTFSVEAVREKVFDFIKTIYNTYISTVYYSDDEIVEKFVPLYPEYIPDGAELVTEEVGETSLLLEYELNKADEMHFVLIHQQQIKDGLVVTDNTEYEKEESCIIHECSATIYHEKDGVVRITWEEKGCLYLVLGTNVEKGELLKICDSLK